MNEFYHSLKKFRKEKGFTIREVAHRSGVSSSYISQLENGNRGIPSPEILHKLSEGLNLPYVELMSAAGYLDIDAETGTQNNKASYPLNLRKILQQNEITFDGILLTDRDKEWIERLLTALFWKQKKEEQDLR